eukprot:SAG22_NODE_374_length_11548_cov_6.893615_3_plen_267_part_00
MVPPGFLKTPEYLAANLAARDKLTASCKGRVPVSGPSAAPAAAAAAAAASGSATSPQSDDGFVQMTATAGRVGDRVFPLGPATAPLPIADGAPAGGPPASLTDFWARTGDPWLTGEGRPISQMSNLADSDEVLKGLAAHPAITGVLRRLLGENVKLWFDHIFCKAPMDTRGYARGANRFHQDGFFQFSKPSVTAWIALDAVTEANGAFHYLPKTLGYGEFDFDAGLGSSPACPSANASTGGLSPEQLRQERVLTLEPGDAVFHDRW